jgi:hypothetical protein
MSKLYIGASRNAHPIVISEGRRLGCQGTTHELFESLQNAGISKKEIARARAEIEERTYTVLESAKLTGAEFAALVARCSASEPA